MFSKAIVALLAATSVVALPGGGDWGNQGGEQECETTCSTELCTQTTVYQKTEQWPVTKTDYYPVTTYAPSTYQYTKTYTKTETTQIVGSKAITTVIYQPYTTESCYEVPYTSVCEETTSVPYVTQYPTESVCTESKVVPYTSTWVETQTTCSTIYSKPTNGWSQGGSGGWGGWGGDQKQGGGW